MLRLFAQYKAVQSSVQELIRSLRIEGLERFTQIVPVGWNITRVWFPSPSPFWQHFCVPRSMFHFKVPSFSGITEVAFYLSPIKCESTSPSWSDNTKWPRQVRELIHDLDRNGMPQENGSKGTCSPYPIKVLVDREPFKKCPKEHSWEKNHSKKCSWE